MAKLIQIDGKWYLSTATVAQLLRMHGVAHDDAAALLGELVYEASRDSNAERADG